MRIPQLLKSDSAIAFNAKIFVSVGVCLVALVGKFTSGAKIAFPKSVMNQHIQKISE